MLLPLLLLLLLNSPAQQGRQEGQGPLMSDGSQNMVLYTYMYIQPKHRQAVAAQWDANTTLAFRHQQCIACRLFLLCMVLLSLTFEW
jgi:hypothetical protein